MKHYAPAGTPVTLRDIAAGLSGSRVDASADIAQALGRASPPQSVWLVSSGRAAMTLILRAMRDEVRDAQRDEVIIPAYTCYSVPSAIVRAGLRVRVCDVNARTLSMDTYALDKCNFAKVLAVVSANLYGLPNDLDCIESICKRRGVFFLDDAAQALGATLNGRQVGSYGDAGLYSFDRGKIISTMQGGAALCSNDRLKPLMAKSARELSPASRADVFLIGAKLLGYSIFLRPRLYGIVHKVPFLGLGRTAFETRYPITRLSRFQAVIAARMFERLQSLNHGRCRRAAEYAHALQDVPGIKLVPLRPGATAVFSRFPFFLAGVQSRPRVLASLTRAGIGASASYPNSIPDAPDVRSALASGSLDCPGAREVAGSIVTLPTHAYCPPDIALKVRTLLNECLS